MNTCYEVHDISRGQIVYNFVFKSLYILNPVDGYTPNGTTAYLDEV